MRRSYLKRFFLLLLSIQFLFCFSIPVFAAAADNGKNGATQQNGATTNEISKKFCKIIDLLKGGPMKTVAIIGIMAVGIGTFTGRFQWSTALVTVGGVIIIFSAETVVGMFATNNDSAIKCDEAPKP